MMMPSTMILTICISMVLKRRHRGLSLDIVSRLAGSGLGAGADPAIDGPGGRLPLWAALSEKTNEIWSVDSQENH